MRKSNVTFGLAVLVAALAGTAFSQTRQPVRVVEVRSDKQAIVALAPQRILYAEGSSLVIKSTDATAADFEDLYVVLTPNWFALPERVSSKGEVIDFAPAKFAVMRLAPHVADELSAAMHNEGLACGVMVKLTGEPVSMQLRATPTPIIPVATRDARVQNFASLIQADNIRVTIEELSAIYTRYSNSATGRGVAALLADKYEALRGADRSDVTISTYSHGTATSQDSLVVRITGQVHPEEVIVLGSHIDSINQGGPSSQRAPGADDNASGTATNMEIFRILMEQDIRLDRTLEIHGYAAEENGLVGSQNIANAYRAANINVVAMVQHDMTLWKAAGAADKIYFVTTNTDAGFNGLLATLASNYAGVPTAMMSLSGGSSDHASWRRAGYATAFPFENPGNYNNHIHSANDTIANSGAFTQAAAFARLGIAYIAHFGGLQ